MKNIYLFRKKKIKKYNKLLLKEDLNNNIKKINKYKVKLKHRKYNCFEINIDFLIKFSIPILIILFIIFLALKFKIKKKRKIIKANNIIEQNKIKNKTYNYFACFVGMGKQENKYVRELVDYYSKLGVEKFILADNNLPNTEKLSDVLQDYISNGIVEIIEIFGSSFGQAELYNATYEKYKTKCNWFLFFDFDEFLEVFFEKGKNLVLNEFLTNTTFDKCESVLFNWVIYSDNDLIHYDNRTVIERFTDPYFNSKANVHVKCVVRGGLNKTVFISKKSNHVPERGVTICDSKGNIRPGYNPFIIAPPIHDYGYLKHFTTKTAEEYCDKMIRGQPRNQISKQEDRVKLFFMYNKFSQEKLDVFEKKFNKKFNPILDSKNFRGNK